ncbi:MAG: peptidoglycan-associated lipoprotein Pal [Geobacteraceae bacterium]|nr:peptidoglycan-associated lipoprotein Pal [Geobacteraceae bacterium]
MKREMITLLAALSMTALVSGGCANKEAVKTEEPAAATIKAEPVKAEPVKTEAAKPVQEPSSKIEENKIVPAKAAEPAATPAPETVLETVYFDFDKSDLTQDARNVLSKNAETLLKSMKDAKIKIEGNCDERGSAEYNLALGERRAKSAQQYLLTLGVQPDRLSIISYGKEKPAVDGHDEAAWAKNRRDDFVIVK